jgi:hypothetical protein
MAGEFRTFETVWRETPAARATSSTVGAFATVIPLPAAALAVVLNDRTVILWGLRPHLDTAPGVSLISWLA